MRRLVVVDHRNPILQELGKFQQQNVTQTKVAAVPTDYSISFTTKILVSSKTIISIAHRFKNSFHSPPSFNFLLQTKTKPKSSKFSESYCGVDMFERSRFKGAENVPLLSERKSTRRIVENEKGSNNL